MHPWNMGWWGGWGPWATWGAGGWPWPGLLWLIAFLLFWGGLLALLIWAVRLSATSRRESDDTRESSDEILRRRLANSEITPEEYDHIRRILHE